MSHAAQSTISSHGTSGAARVRKIVCRIYGTLAVLYGLAGAALAAFIIWLRYTGGSLRSFFGEPDGSHLSFDISADSIPAFFGPYNLVISLICVVLGVLIFRQWVIAAIVLLCFTVVVDVLSGVLPGNFPAALNAESFTNVNVIYYAILLILTAAVVIADRAARRGPASQA